MSRKLASIQIIREIEPIEGADRIELAHVLGWECVVNRGQFQPGDKAVYFEIDRFLPVCDTFEFLRTSSYRNSTLLGEGFRLCTMKFRGLIYLRDSCCRRQIFRRFLQILSPERM